MNTLEWVAKFLTFITLPLGRSDKRTLLYNLQRVFSLPPQSVMAHIFFRQVRLQQILCGLETLLEVWRPRSLRIDGVEAAQQLVQAAKQKNHGVIFITAHLGSWEMAGHMAAQMVGGEFHVLAKKSRSAFLNKLLDGVRKKLAMQVLWNSDKSILRQMLQTLKNGQGLGFVMDQKPEGRVGPVVDFFGIPTAFVGGPAAMAVRTGAAVFGLYCVRQGPRLYRLVIHPLLASQHGETDEVAVTQTLARDIEQMIRLYPEQWCWNYRRWPVPSTQGR